MGCISLDVGAFSFGTQDTASGYYSLAMGTWSKATDDVDIAIGFRCKSLGIGCTAIGSDAVADGYYSVSLGNYTESLGYSSFAFGQETKATGSWATSGGYMSKAAGEISTAIGNKVYAKSFCEFTVGQYNDTSISTDSYGWTLTNPLFIIGNGTDASNLHNAVTVLKNGNVGINTDTPDKLLTVNGDARVTGDIYYGVIGSATIYTKPDFVFMPDYTKKYDINYIEKYIRRNGHLPWVTAAKDEKDGINLTRMSFETLEAVENIQLQVIELKKKNKELTKKLKQIEKIKAENKKLKKEI